MNDKYHFKYDISQKKVVNDCTLKPTDILKSEEPWLLASNNKYKYMVYDDTEINADGKDEEGNKTKNEEDDEDDSYIGKWMIFLGKTQVNETWNKIKEAIKDGHLWHSKVSTRDVNDPKYAIMIFTVDYTNLKDVIEVLDFLESSGIKPPGRVIKYKTDKQTKAGIYAGGKQKASIYSSNTVRNLLCKKQSNVQTS